jgi:hypothetical protein
LLIVYGLFAWWWFTSAQEQIKPPEWIPQEKEMVVERMKFHGIDSCIKDENGYFFYRNGRKVKL